MKQKIVIEVQMHCSKCRSKALKIAAVADGETRRKEARRNETGREKPDEKKPDEKLPCIQYPYGPYPYFDKVIIYEDDYPNDRNCCQM
ncbi:hypothetical protein MKW92_051287 [Papaver armeniacum]|nr:hypothetical protein MKW92_051287 [Papaver armeniacum]